MSGDSRNFAFHCIVAFQFKLIVDVEESVRNTRWACQPEQATVCSEGRIRSCVNVKVTGTTEQRKATVSVHSLIGQHEGATKQRLSQDARHCKRSMQCVCFRWNTLQKWMKEEDSSRRKLARPCVADAVTCASCCLV